MATSIDSGGVVTESPAKNGPWVPSNGAVYEVHIDTADSRPTVYKATDPTSSWSEQDATNRPDFSATIGSHDGIVSWLEGDVIHLCTQEDSGGDPIEYHTFNTSTDTWAITNERPTALGGAGAYPAEMGGMSLRSDGDVILTYMGDAEKIMGTNYSRVYYARRESSTWTIDVAIGGAGEDDWRNGPVIRGGSDRMILCSYNDDLDQGYTQTLNSSNSLQSAQQFDSTLSTASTNIFGDGVAYDDGGTIRVRIPYLDSSGDTSILEVTSDTDTPTVGGGQITTSVDASDNNSTNATLAADGTNLHLLYSNTGDFDVYHDENDDDAGWGTDVEERDAVTVHRICANVITVSGTKRLAWLQSTTTGTLEYDEISLAAPTTAVQDPIMRGVIARAR